MLEGSVINRAIYKCLRENPQGATGTQIRFYVREDYRWAFKESYMRIRLKYLKEKGYITGHNRKWTATEIFHEDAMKWVPT